MKKSPATESGVPLTYKSTPADSVQTPKLFQLPDEIREKIFYLALSAVQPIVWPAEHFQHQLCPALLSTCRQIYEEAAPILYRFNRFTFLHPSDCNIFYWIMDRKQVEKITHVAFRVRDKDSILWTTYLSSTDDIRSFQNDFPNLKYLWIFMKSSSWNHTRDPEESFTDWHRNNRLRQLCMALEGRTKAEVSVLYSVKIPDGHYDRLRESQTSVLAAAGPTFLRTNKISICSSQVALELTPYQAGGVLPTGL